MQLQQNNFKIGIVGLGLIGGSIYKSLAVSGFKSLFACSRSETTVDIIRKDGFVASTDNTILKDCEIIFVASPISETFNTIESLFQINKDALYVDVASLKDDIVEKVSNLNGCRFIGSHPMAGTENSGFDASFSGLFNGAKWILTPAKNSSSDDVELLKNIITFLGAIPVVMDAKLHDEVVSLISHTPMLIAQALLHSVQNNDEAMTLAASGFRDMTRLAMSNKFMAADMLRMNKENIQKSLQLIVDNAQRLLDDNYFAQSVDTIIAERKSLYDEFGKNIFRNNC